MLRDLARTGAEHIALPLAGKNPVTIWRNIRRLEAVIRDRDTVWTGSMNWTDDSWSV